MFDSTTPQSNHQQLNPRAQPNTQATSTHTRAGALTFPSSCLDGSVTRVGPGQNPQYTRAPFGEEAVGCSQTTHHSTPPPQDNEPTTLYMRRQSLAVTKKKSQLHIRWEQGHSGDVGNSIADELADLRTRLEAQHRWWKRAQRMGDWEEDVFCTKISSPKREKHRVNTLTASDGQAW